MMNRSTGFLLELAGNLAQSLGQLASVHSSVDGSYCEVSVTPIRDDACRFTIHSEEDTEMTIEFGRFSIGHVYSGDFEAMTSDVGAIVAAIIAGQVHERVGFVKDRPCRAKATIGAGATALTFRTRDGFCVGGKARDFEYAPYRG